MTSVVAQYHQCKICQVPVLPAVWAQHIKGKRHVTFSPKKIVVKGDFDKDKVKELNEYFAKFGVITGEKVRTEEGKVLVEYTFEEVAAYTEIVQMEHKLFDQKLEICWERGHAVVPQTVAPNNSNKAPAKGAPNVAKCVPEQAAGSSGGGPKAPAQDNHATSIQKMAAAESASYKLQIMASVKEGATFADQMAILENKLKVDQAQVENNRRLIRNDLTAALSPMFALNKIYFFGSSITGLDVPGSDLDVYIANIRQQFKSEVMMLKLIRTLIFKCRKFCDVLLISGAKIPIIKCIHTKTQICCDLNIRNKLSVCNSELIKYYLSLDEKLKPLMIMIKFWAERCGLKKVNYFSSYALYMMVIFYLQQEPYSLPSVLELQRHTLPDIVEGWNGSFAPLDFESEALTRASMLDLVAGFFKFYSKFDYAGYVVAPYVGKGVEKTGFLKPYDLPGYYHAYSSQHQVFQVNVSICIQDPFEHSRNVSASVPHNCIGKFVVLCKHAVQMMTQPEKGLLYKLLTNMSSPLNEYSFQMKKNEERDEKEWIQSIKSTTSKLLKEVLRYDVTEIPMFGADHINYTCAGKWNVWENRVNIMKNLQSELPHGVSEIDKEIAVTTCIVKYFPKTLQTKLVVNLTFKRNPCRMEFLAKSKTKCKMFLHVSHFIRVKLQEFMEKATAERDDVMIKAERDDVANEAEKGKMVEGEIQPAEAEENALNTAVSEVPQVDDMIKTVEIKNEEKSCEEKESNEQAECKDVGKDDSVEKIENRVGDDIKTSESVTNDVGEMSKTQEEGEIADEEEEEEEDVPADFFDDFSNQDFMDGLDIVDAWDEDTKLAETEAVVTEESDKKSSHSPIRFVSKDSRKSSEKRSKKHGKSRSRSPLRRHKRSDSHGRKRSKSKSRDKTRTDVRRDPEKTRRDITRDKVKCAKDKEQKLVSDKLKIVETGLVPPGTEMEVDLGTLLRDNKPQPASVAEKPREARPAERRYSRRSGSREVRKPARYSRSPPIYRVRNREREPAYRPRRRTGSIDSNVSERELWIRSSRKRTRSRSRESRAKQRKYEEEKKKKKTFLEEIRDKLNEVRTPVPQAPVQVMYGYNNGPPHQMAAPAPVPAPAPNQFFQVGSNPAMQQYDQSFFIGEGYQNVMMPHPQVDFNMMGSAGNVVQPVSVGQVAPMQPAAAAVKLPVVPQQQALVSPKVSSDSVAKANEQKDNQMTDDIDKLFADKKISLSDFLTITAKCEVQSSTPEHLQKKIKVISRCQDAIKAMSEDRKFSGRLLVKPSTEGKNKSEVKYQSPLRRIPIVRFQFTSPAKACEEVDSFAAVLDKILQKIGVLQDIVDLNESTESVAKVLANSAFSDEETAALTLKACLLNSKKPTDGVGCEECKKRKAIKHAEVGSQCVKETNSVGVQVNEEDLNPSRTPSKNESIAYLTPAQLLGKDKDKEAEKVKETVEVSKEMGEKMKVETKTLLSDTKKEKPKTPSSRGGRGGFRKTLKDKPPHNFVIDGYDFVERRRPLLEDPRDFRNRYGGPMRFPRPFPDEVPPHILHLHQFRDDANFTDFAQPLRGRNPKFGPRF